MSLDGGGWTLVWKNSFMDNFPLSENMRYYSEYYKACTSLVDGGWCKKIMDKCTHHNGVQPAPHVHAIPGITSDKRTPYNYYSYCDTLYGTLTSPNECRWYDCHLPLSISSSKHSVQMMMAIFVH